MFDLSSKSNSLVSVFVILNKYFPTEYSPNDVTWVFHNIF